MDEFMSGEEAELHKMYSDFNKHLQIAKEEMGLIEFNALYFLGVLFGNAIKPD